MKFTNRYGIKIGIDCYYDELQEFIESIGNQNIKVLFEKTDFDKKYLQQQVDTILTQYMLRKGNKLSNENLSFKITIGNKEEIIKPKVIKNLYSE